MTSEEIPMVASPTAPTTESISSSISPPVSARPARMKENSEVCASERPAFIPTRVVSPRRRTSHVTMGGFTRTVIAIITTTSGHAARADPMRIRAPSETKNTATNTSMSGWTLRRSSRL
jgi:hypothetical protein